MQGSDAQPDATRLMVAASEGDRAAADQLLPLVYEQLRAAARQQMARERDGHTFSATALVHEAYVKLAGPREIPFTGRGHFYAAAAESMRRILIDRARARGALKRGGGARRLTIDLSSLVVEDAPDGLLELDEALTRLAQQHPDKAELVKLRFFAGLTLPQAATVLGMSTTTADRHYAFARAWLYADLADDKGI